MKSEFKHPHELNESELTQIYAIHEKVYASKGVGLEFDVWKYHLLKKRYHDVADKLLQLFRFYDDNRIDGYNILTDPVQIDGNLWSKLLEVGSAPQSRRDAKQVFLDMYEELFALRNNIIHFGEAGVEYHTVTNLLIEAKLDILYDVSQLDTVFNTFLRSNEFTLYRSEHGVEIKRKTFITPAYHGYVLVHDYRNNLNSIVYGADE